MIFIVNLLGLFLWKINKVLQLLMLSRAANQRKYGQIEAVNFTIDQLNQGYKRM